MPVNPTQTPPPFEQEKMQSLLLELKQLQVTDDISVFPLAIGWWLLITMLMTVMLWLLYRILRRWQYYRFSQTALALYQTYADEFAHGGHVPRYLRQTNQLLKRIVIKLSGSQRVGVLYGHAWQQILARTPLAIPDEVAHALCTAYYHRQATLPISAMNTYIQQWITLQKPSLYTTLNTGDV